MPLCFIQYFNSNNSNEYQSVYCMCGLSEFAKIQPYKFIHLLTLWWGEEKQDGFKGSTVLSQG